MRSAAHIEYIYHITCQNCKFYWTYATMDKKFDIEKNNYHCPNCGTKTKIKLEGEIK